MADVLGPGGIMEVGEEEIVHKCVREGGAAGRSEAARAPGFFFGGARTSSARV